MESKAFLINIFKDGDNKVPNTWVHDRFTRDGSPSVIILIGIIQKGSASFKRLPKNTIVKTTTKEILK
jgi:hypothetical protein